jgi:hypothetical protein
MERMKDWKGRPFWLRWKLCKNILLSMAALPMRLYKNMPLPFKEFLRVLIVCGSGERCANWTEYATDVLFQDAASLARLYPSWVHHAMTSFSSPDVMRFLGRRFPLTAGRVNGHFKGEIISDCKHRPEGVRVKHSLRGHSIKFCDMQGACCGWKRPLSVRKSSAATAGRKESPKRRNSG